MCLKRCREKIKDDNRTRKLKWLTEKSKESRGDEEAARISQKLWLMTQREAEVSGMEL
jgi:hypothetical protein